MPTLTGLVALAVVVAAGTGGCAQSSSLPVGASAAGGSGVTARQAAPDGDGTWSRADRVVERTTEAGQVRRLPVQVWVPGGRGPFPVVGFAHGMSGHPDKFTQLFGAWVKAGYAVVAPVFPVTSDPAVDVPTAVVEMALQPADLGAALDSVTASARPGGELAGRIDPDRIGVAGLSLGGGTVLGFGYHRCCADPRPRVVVAMSPLPFGVDNVAPDLDGTPPLLLIHGTDDPRIPYASSVTLAESASGPGWFLTLDGAGHAQPYEDEPSDHDQLVVDATLAVFDAYLGDDPAGIDRLEGAVRSRGGARLTTI